MPSTKSQELSTGWEFSLVQEQSIETWLPVAKVPSVVHLDLMENGKIPEISHGMNELAAHWVCEKSWAYRCKFTTPQVAEKGSKISLVFEGLDTFATVQLNGTAILTSDNMFLAHRVDVTGLVCSDSPNTLRIDFVSARVRGRAIIEGNPEHRYLSSLGSPERLAVRKAQYHWGWDWGPTCVTAGPWRPVRLETYRSRIDDISMRYELTNGLKTCQITISARIDGQPDDTVKLTLTHPDYGPLFEKMCVADGEGCAQTTFVLQDPLLWHPHGYGEQHQYLLQAELITGQEVVHSLAKKVAFRKAELIQEADAYGKSFYFRINEVDIFAGGSCWIPADIFLPRLTSDSYRSWLNIMVDGNQIMIRIWGGGIYEESVFYDICDELGILVWQDFMFACGSYPTSPSFLASLEAEVRYNLRRLRQHPSVVIYAGGNENYYIQELYGLEYDYAGDKDPQSWLRSTFPSRYIFEHLLPGLVSEEVPNAIYHTDSPWGDGKNILDPSVGDIHQWEVWHGVMRPYQHYDGIGGRFNSEFGMQSFPHMSTVDRFVSELDEKHPQSETMDFHNKCKTHEKRLATYVRDNFRASDSSLKYWVYLTQLLQSEAMHYAYRGWRRQWGKPQARQCGGALAWQLNDCWPVVSWALADYYLVKKPAFYTVKRDLSPLAIAVVRTHDDWINPHSARSGEHEFDVWIACDGSNTARELKNTPDNQIEVELDFVSVRTGQEILARKRYDVAAIEWNATTVVCEGVKIPKPNKRDAFVISAKLFIGGKLICRDVDWPQPYKYLSFQEDRGLQVQLAASRTSIEISVVRPVKCLTFAERPGLKLSDNGIDVLPGEIHTIGIDGLGEDEQLDWNYLGINESIQ